MLMQILVLMTIFTLSHTVAVPRSPMRLINAKVSQMDEKMHTVLASVSPDMVYTGLGAFTVISIYQKVILAR